MIKTFTDKALEQCWRYDDCRKINSDLKRRVLMKLDSMDAATNLDDLKNPPGNHLHPLRGEYSDCWAISVSGPWRLIFKFENNNIYDIQLVQYH